MTGATPPFVPLARHGEGGVSATVSGTVSDPPRLRGGRSRLYVSLQEGSPARTRAGRRAETSGAVLVRSHTPNVYRAVVAWYYVAPGVAAFLAGQFLISTSRIWFARMGVRVGRRSRLPTWPLSPSADGPASRVEGRRVTGRVRWLIRRFRAGPQSESRRHVSSPRSPNPAGRFPAPGSPVESCDSHTGFPVAASGRVSRAVAPSSHPCAGRPVRRQAC